MPEDRKKALVALLAKHAIPLIEDDAYAELFFGAKRPLPAKAFDNEGLVMNCGSFSRCLAPGYRVGWVAGGRFSAKIEQMLLMYTLSPAIPAEAAIAAYLDQGGYDRHLRRMRKALAGYLAGAVETVEMHDTVRGESSRARHRTAMKQKLSSPPAPSQTTLMRT
ncbi:aminotransferase class I/II-fold pyridoxal phosphate-dependent enzyme [Variovorax gracilis]|uniref:aminotransferase class I/II-fold pyridoxal phosphate-dependent enzyme n=1 Tax=Variovorax gracilis TaxID=3053502 RepID=UPI004037EB0B